MTAKTAKPEEPKGRKLSPQQIQIAAQAGVQLIAEGRVNVPSDMAMNGTLGVLNGLLSALAQGSSVLASPAFIKELQEKVKAAEKKPAAKKPRKRAPARKRPAATKK